MQGSKQKATNWSAVKRDFITENLLRSASGRDPMPLKELAQKWGINYGTMRNLASNEKWNDELANAIVRKNTEAVEKTREAESFNEAEVRVRQARFARLATSKAIYKINAIDPEQLSVREAIDLLRLGLVEERKALGMADVYTLTPPHQGEQGEYRSVIDHINRQRDLVGLGEKLLQFVEDKTGGKPPSTTTH